jgi:hypothetical protein
MLKSSFAAALALLLAAGLASTAEARGKRYVPHIAAAGHSATVATQSAAAAEGTVLVARRYGKR